ncbi:MAG: CFI-box-CTERM domain-containing protein [Haloferacaceae archaeon]
MGDREDDADAVDAPVGDAAAGESPDSRSAGPDADRSGGDGADGSDRGGTGDEIGDDRPKHVTVVTDDGERIDHGEVYFRHTAAEFVVADPDDPDATTRYAKDDLLRVEVTQHHAACFVTTATAGRGPALDALRGFRDDVLGRSRPGRALVGVYYALSPPVARTLADHPDSGVAVAVRWLVRRCASLERRRRATASPLAARTLAVALTLLYAVGVTLGVVGHGWLRGRERLWTTA